MQVYGFWCDCGHTAEQEFSANDPEKRLHCPRCGAYMYRDYSNIGIVGDLPSKRQGNISRMACTDDEMADGALMKEVDYVEKHHGPSAREQNTATDMVNGLAKEHRTKQRSKMCDEIFDRVLSDKPAGLDMTNGGA